MKPIRLELQEFGPYKHEVIEWSKIINEPIFLITGKTGAGKSTLFDAMVYALYNKTSGGKNIDSLRSKTADDKIKTKVIFDFEIREKRYRLERTLAYLKKGNRSLTAGKVEFMQINGDNIKVIASKETTVNEKVVELLGLDDKQFCQIIILPQGEFKKLLLSKSSEKATILRSLFNTYLYQKFVEKLQNYAKELASEYKVKEKELINRFSHFKFSNKLEEVEYLQENSFDNLKDELKKQEKEKNNLDQDLKEKEEEFLKLQNNYLELSRVDDKFIQLDNYNNEYKNLQAKEENITSLNQIIEKLEELEKNKHKIELYYTLLEKIKSEKNKSEELIEKKANYIKEFENNNNLGDYLKSIAETNKKELEYAEERVYFYNNIKSYKEAFFDEKKYLLEISNLEADKNKLRECKAGLEGQIAKQKEIEEDNTLVEKELNNIKLEILKKEYEVENLENYYKLIAEIENKLKKVKDYKSKLERLLITKEELENKVDEIEKNKNRELINNLVEQLHIGDDCPVCKQKIKHLPKKENVVQLDSNCKDELENITKEIIKLETTFQKNKEDIAELEKKSGVLKIGINKQAAEELEELSNNENILKEKSDKIKQSLKKIQKAVNESEKEIVQLEEVLQKEQSYKEKLLSAQIKISQYKEKIKDNVDDFEKYYNPLLDKIKDFQEKEKIYNETKNNLALVDVKLDFEIKNNKEQSEKLEIDKSKLTEEFNNSKLKHYYNNIEIANDNLSEIKKLEEYRLTVNEYNNNVNILLNNIERLEKELLGQQRPQLKQIKLELDKKGNSLEEIKKEAVVLETIFNANNELYNALLGEYTIWKKEVGNSNEIIHLSNVISGKTDNKKSLETYVQGYYLDLILEAGSRRFLKMSEGRYSFIRKLERQKGNGLQGLDIEVYDVNSNSNRDVSSLSGGELFLASLSLALGLAEIIQQESGSISLETIFIDEGFGSLDSETLDTAISTLIELQSYGRNIGIISHVSELKERIRAGVEVYSDNNSSKVKIVGI